MKQRGFSGEEVVEAAGCVFFWKPPAVFGQWTTSWFTVDGVSYSSAEQFMMAAKARLFRDAEILAKILATPNPKTQKALGRKVRGYVDATWVAARFEAVVAGNLAKFSQNPPMLEELLATGELTLVEASPYDRVWGIGLRADDPRALHPSTWQGQNLLGKALEQVRAQLRG